MKSIKSFVLGLALVSLVLASGLASATLLETYGRILADFEVEGPTFYATNNSVSSGVNLRETELNEFTTEPGNTSFRDGDFIAFTSGPLNVTGFYPIQFNFQINASTNQPDQQLELRAFTYDQENDKINDILCSTLVTVESSDYQTYTASCQTSGDLSLDKNEGFYWKISGWNTNETVQFNFSLDNSTRFEVSDQ